MFIHHASMSEQPSKGISILDYQLSWTYYFHNIPAMQSLNFEAILGVFHMLAGFVPGTRGDRIMSCQALARPT